jgi:hypothetical protein
MQNFEWKTEIMEGVMVVILHLFLRNEAEKCGLDSSGLEYVSAMDCFENNNKYVDSTKKRMLLII